MRKVKFLKWVLGLFFLLSLLSCEGGLHIFTEDFSDNSTITITSITRSVVTDWDPKIEILSRKAYFSKGEVIIERPISIRGYKGNSGWVVKKMRIENNKLIISIPHDCKYYVKIILISKTE